MKNYYLEVLNLEAGATERGIKRAYRRLAKQYHPDRSTRPDAEERFVEIAEAYRFLTEVGPAPHQESIRYDYDPLAEEYERRRQKAREFAQQRAAERYRQRVIATSKVNQMLSAFVAATLFFQVLLITDYYLPPQQHIDKVADIVPGQRNVTGGFVIIRLQQASLRIDYEVDHKRKMMIQKGNTVKLYRTPLLSIPHRAIFRLGSYGLTVLPKYTVYRGYYFIIFVATASSLIFFALDTHSENRTIAGIVALMAVTTQLYLF